MKNFICFVEAANSFNNYSNLFLCKELSNDDVLSFSTKILLNNLFENMVDGPVDIIKCNKSSIVDKLISAITIYDKLSIKYDIYLFQSNESKYEFMSNLIEYIKNNSIESNENYKQKFYKNGDENNEFNQYPS